MSPNGCPSEQLLERYAKGSLSELEAQAVDTHLAVCSACLERLDRLSDRPDPLAAALRLKREPLAETSPVLAGAVAAVLGGNTLFTAPSILGTEQEPQINGYRLLDELGHGGMGRVYRALHPRLDQEVALKVLRSAFDQAPFQARFEAERQALALMDHPHIARVLDGGVTPQGQPFFVMELVRGVPITRYCDEHRLDLRRRLELFILVCQAVQHAHQKGIIHRDLKPSNVLVAEFDGKPAPKVIDFGVAKAIERRTAAETEVGMVVGTPEYMSPEQADLSSQDIDTRSDVYALGMVLYELVAGDSPFGRRRMHDKPVLEVLRLVREEEPPAPSSKLATAETAVEVAAQRGTAPTRLIRLVKGDLDCIVLKALEKDRTRRYDTAAALAEDVRRFLNDEPVQAGPPSGWYRVKKFVQRHRAPVVAAAAVLLALVVATTGTSIALVHARRQQAIAEQERDEKNTALLELEREQGNTRAALLMESAARKRAMSALRSLTDDVVERQLGRQVTLTKEDQAFLQKIAAEYEAFAAVRGNGEESRALRAEGNLRLAILRRSLGKHVEALASYERARAQHLELTADFPGSPDHALRLAATHNGLGNLLKDLGRPEEAAAEFRRALALGKRLVAELPAMPICRQQLANYHLNLGNLLASLGKPAEAEAEYSHTFTLMSQLAADFPNEPLYRRELAQSQFNLGIVLRRLKKPQEAEKQNRLALALSEKLVADFPGVPGYRTDLANGYENLGRLLYDLGRFVQAEAEYRRALLVRKQLAAEFPTVPSYRADLARGHTHLGNTLEKLKKAMEAETEFGQALDLLRQLVRDFPQVPDYAVSLGGCFCNFGNLLRTSGKPAEALDWYRQAIDRLTPIVEQQPQLIEARQFLDNSHHARALALMKLDRFAEAVKDWDRALHLDDGSRRTVILVRRAACLARFDPRQAVAVAEQLSKGEQPPAQLLYSVATLWSLSSAHVKDQGECDQYAARAVALLHQLREQGYFHNQARVEFLKRDADLDPLRQRDDFKKLLADLGSLPR